jgi:hypothetical protein
MVLSFASFDIYLCPIEVLGRWLLALLDPKPASQFPYCLPFSPPHIRFCLSPSHKHTTFGAGQKKGALAIRDRLSKFFNHPSRHPCHYICFDPAIYFAHPNCSSTCCFHAFGVLGRHMAPGLPSDVWPIMDSLELSLGRHIYYPMGSFSSTSIVSPRGT